MGWALCGHHYIYGVLECTSFLLSGIELVSETSEEELKSAEGCKPTLAEGIDVAYTVPAETPVRTFPKSSLLFSFRLLNILLLC